MTRIVTHSGFEFLYFRFSVPACRIRRVRRLVIDDVITFCVRSNDRALGVTPYEIDDGGLRRNSEKWMKSHRRQILRSWIIRATIRTMRPN